MYILGGCWRFLDIKRKKTLQVVLIDLEKAYNRISRKVNSHVLKKKYVNKWYVDAL